MPGLASILARVLGEQAVRLVLQATGLGAVTAVLDAGKQVYDELQKRQFVTQDQLARLVASSPEERQRIRDEAVAEAVRLSPHSRREAEEAVRLVENRFFEYLIDRADETAAAQYEAVVSAKETKLRGELESSLVTRQLRRALGRVNKLVALRPDSVEYLRLQRRLERSLGGSSNRATNQGALVGALLGFVLGVGIGVNALLENYGWPLRPEWGALLGLGAFVAFAGACVGGVVAAISDYWRVRQRDRRLGDD